MNTFKNILSKIRPQKQSWIEKNNLLVIVVAVLLFMSMALLIGLCQSVWFDEAYSILVAKQSVGELLRLTALDTHPPLYYVVLHFWAGLFGWGELALRSLSVIMAGGAVFVGALLVRRLFGVRAALITLPFLLFAPFLLRYGFEIRMYAMASLICISATYLLVAALDAKTRKQKWLLYGGYAVLVALGVYTLYYTALVWIAHLVWLVWVTYKAKQPLAKQPWLLAYLGSVLLFLPWLPTFVSQVGNGALAAISQPLTVDNLVSIVSFQFLYQPTWQLDAVWSLVFVALVVALSILAVRGARYISKPEKKYVVLLLAYFMVPIIVLTLISLVRPMYVERYLAHVVIGILLLTGAMTAFAVRDKTNVTKLLAGLVVVILASGTAHLIQVGNYNFQRLQLPRVNLAAEVTECKDGNVVLAADPYTAIELMYYLPPECDLRFYSETASLSGGYAPLSNSPKRVADPATELSDKQTIIYVHYDEPRLTLPPHLRETQVIGLDSLKIATFSAE